MLCTLMEEIWGSLCDYCWNLPVCLVKDDGCWPHGVDFGSGFVVDREEGRKA